MVFTRLVRSFLCPLTSSAPSFGLCQSPHHGNGASVEFSLKKGRRRRATLGQGRKFRATRGALYGSRLFVLFFLAVWSRLSLWHANLILSASALFFRNSAFLFLSIGAIESRAATTVTGASFKKKEVFFWWCKHKESALSWESWVRQQQSQEPNTPRKDAELVPIS